MHSFEVHSNESACRKKVRLGLEQVYVYAIGSKSGLNYVKVLQDRFCEHRTTINIWSDNTQEYFMGSVRKLLCNFGLGSKQSKAHKKNQKPDECFIQEIKGTTRTFIDSSGAPSWSWILCIAYVVAILNCM